MKLKEMLNTFNFLLVFISVSDELEEHRRKKANILFEAFNIECC